MKSIRAKKNNEVQRRIYNLCTSYETIRKGINKKILNPRPRSL